jgi:CheY-like chemotaxis protein
MKNQKIMIVSKPGTRQRIILNHLAKYPFLDVKDIVNGSLTALQRITSNCPDLLLIDCFNPTDDTAVLINKVKAENQSLQIIVIADTNHQRRKLINAGADFAISSYNCESDLSKIFEEMKPPSVNQSETIHTGKAEIVTEEEKVNNEC